MFDLDAMDTVESLKQRVLELEDVNRQLAAKEASLWASERVIRQVLETVPSGILLVGPRGDLQLANQTALGFLGRSLEELTARSAHDLSGDTVHEDGRPCPVEDHPVTRCLRTGAPQPRITLGVRQRSGELRWAIFRALPVELVDGRGAIITFIDITDRRAAEAERQDLGTRIAQAERLASLGTLAAGLAHEINNPLTVLLGNVEMALLDSNLSAELRQQLEDTREGASRIARIVRDIGAFSRRDSDEIAPFNVCEAVREAIRLTLPQHRHRAEIITAIPQGCAGLGQEWRAVQVFVNLLSNAALACPEGHADEHRIRISAAVEDAEVVVRIEDNGCGMGPDAAARAFQPFFTTRDVGAGTGLGLSISHGIIVGMGGSIELESEAGVGTVVRVHLPRSEAAAPEPSQATPAPQPTERRTGRLAILVVDDEPTIRDITRAALAAHELTVVGSGRAALEACAEREFDAILLDLMMPELTGADVVRALERTAPGQAARVVLMTGGAFTPELRAFVESGVYPVVPKPFSLVALREALRAAAARRP